MNIKILNSSLNLQGIIDSYESFFVSKFHGQPSMAVLTVEANKKSADKLIAGNILKIDNEPFFITDIPKTFGKKGQFLQVSAFDIFWLLSGRTSNTGATAIEYSSKSVEYIIKDLIDKNIISATDSDRQIANISAATNQDRGSVVNSTIFQTGLAEDVKKLLAIDTLGIKAAIESGIVIDLYQGTDRSSSSSTPVTFDVKFDNVLSGEEKYSTANVKNIAYVLGLSSGSRIVEKYGTATGSSRREVVVDAGENNDLESVAEASLITSTESITFDLSSLSGSFTYKEDYFLGDIVTIIKKDLMLIQVDEVFENQKAPKIVLVFGQPTKTVETEMKSNTARIQSLETKVISNSEPTLPTPTPTPTGVVWEYAGAAAPSGWLICDGNAVSRTTYADLFTAIGTVYGSGDGSTTFNIPDRRENVGVGYKSGSTEFGTLGGTTGSKTVTLVKSEMPIHTHIQNSHTHTQNSHNHSQQAHYHSSRYAGFTSVTYNSGGYFLLRRNQSGDSYHGTDGDAAMSKTAVNNAYTATNQSKTATNQNSGSGTSHSNIQPTIVMNYIIKT